LFDRREEEAEAKDGIETAPPAKKVKVESELKKERVKVEAAPPAKKVKVKAAPLVGKSRLRQHH
jgi:hypothetical protein